MNRRPSRARRPGSGTSSRRNRTRTGSIAPRLHLHRWTDRNVIAIAIASFASGFAQFGAVAALSDVAKYFGQITHGTTIADQAGLSGTTLGIGLAIIRLASLGGLPLAGLADRFGRRTLLLLTVGAGLVLTALAAASPTYWWFVAIFACGRPLLSATNALAQVNAAEQTGTHDRAMAMALVAGAYGMGAGLTAFIHSLWVSSLGFRGLFALALVPLIVLVRVRRWITEPERFTVSAASTDHPLPVFGVISTDYRRRLIVVALFTFTLSWISGPANSFIFLYARDIVHQRGGVTALMIVGAGITGFAGLILGRWLADHIGRRPTAALGMVGIALFALLTYSGSRNALVIGYILGVLAGSVLAPAIGSLVNELFPTSVRASVSGWCIAASVTGAVLGLITFGALADVHNRFALAGALTFLPAIVGVGLFWLVPETKGREADELWLEMSPDQK